MTWYGAQQRVEVIRRPIYFHDDSMRMEGWNTLGGWIIIGGNAANYNEDTVNQNNAGGPGNGLVCSKTFAPVVSAGNNRYIIVRIVSVPSGGRGWVRLYNTGTITWELVLADLTEGTHSAVIPAGTYNQILIEADNAADMVWDYVAISKYDVVVVDSPVNDVWRRDERNEVSETEFIAKYDEDLVYAYRGRVKIWKAGGLSGSLIKQFTGWVTKISQVGTGVLKQLKIHALSNTLVLLDRDRTINFKYKEEADDAVLSVVNALVTRSEITIRSVAVFTEQIEMKYDAVNMYEILQDIALDPRVNASFYVDFGDDLNFFRYGTRTSDESIVASDIISPYVRTDDASPGQLVNSATVYGAWTGVWPTTQDGVSFCESFTKSDLVESSIEYIWYVLPAGGGLGDYDLRAQQGPMALVGTSYLLATYSCAAASFTDALVIGRTFYPWVDGTKWSQQNFYWRATTPVTGVVVLMIENWAVDYYMTRLKPNYGANFVANAWAGEQWMTSELTMVPYGEQAIDVEGEPLWKTVGNPHWDKMRVLELQFHFAAPQQNVSVIVDGMYFSGFRWVGGWKDVPSTQSYGSCVRSYEGEYQTSEECANVAFSIVQKFKDPTVTLDRLQLKPRVTLVPAEDIHVSFPVIDDYKVLEEVHLHYEQGKLDTEVQLGETRQGYIQYELEERRKKRQLKELQDEAARRRHLQYGRYQKYSPE